MHITQVSEWLIMLTNTAAGGFIFWMNTIKQPTVFMYILAAWMIGSALYVLINRMRRVQSERRFDRSLLGDLQHAIATATYQVRLSRIMRWNTLPIAALILLSFYEGHKPLWIALATAIFFILVFYASGWEHNIYKRKKQELETLLQKLHEQ